MLNYPHLACQAEKEADRMDWVNKITVVIASILNSDFLLQVGSLFLYNPLLSSSLTRYY